MKTFKKLLLASITLMLVVTLNLTGAKADWRQNSTGWWYTEGHSYAKGWKSINGNWYYFYNNGHMAKDTTIDGYYLNSSGAWINNCNTNTDADFVLYQLPPQGKSQMMSYLIKTNRNGKLLVIDGGVHEDTSYLKKLIIENGGKVDTWIITHPHPDHIDALTDILNSGDIVINKIYDSLPERSWLENVDTTYIKEYDDFITALNKSKVMNIDVKLFQTINIDGINVEFLSTKNPEITINGVNNSSVVFKVISSKKNVLFLGDAGIEEGDKLLKTVPHEILTSQYVQMAHHGQKGVNEDFYKVVNPSYCLWPTPKWLWDNDSGAGYNSGPWDTLQTRKWMADIGVKKNYPACEGLIEIK